MRCTHTSPSRRTILIACVGIMSLASGTARAQDVKATVRIETAGSPPMSMEYWMGAESVRIDIAQPQQVAGLRASTGGQQTGLADEGVAARHGEGPPLDHHELWGA